MHAPILWTLCLLNCTKGGVVIDDSGALQGDRDGDGYVSEAFGGDDCDDDDPNIHPGATDAAYDGVDSDCAGDSDDDADGDGHDAASRGGDDCDDADASVSPSAEEIWYDGFDQNCDEANDYDADADGYDSADHGGEDCIDDDPDAYPGAYDQPDDGIDQDCDGEDRSIDGVVVPYGDTVEVDLEFDLSGYGGMDVVILMDTTSSMGSALTSFSFTELDEGLAELPIDVAYGFATYDDYNYATYGTGSDRPFILQQQVTDDVAAAQAALIATALHSGSDSPESGMEALYQTLTGAGYDQDCGATYDDTTDVLPFVADASDPFGGAGGESYTSGVSGSGTLGGVGFGGISLPLVIYVTDNTLRDPDAGSGTPGGCDIDAGVSDVVTAATDLGAFLVGIAYNGTTPVTQMTELAEATGSLVDSGGDGVADAGAVYSAPASTLTASILGAIEDVFEVVELEGIYDEVVLDPITDTYGLVTGISPSSYTAVDTSTTSSLSFTATLDGTTTSSVPLTGQIVFQLVGDGRVMATEVIEVEIPPG
ncbi:MAG: hypothetical protein GY913_36180 [Proteobacteria bacterium]|nr:hypothetical protein [Pseudomonadota bacterium]MCP4922370.1 hypothetical protein [Pseudomonadota bacterium]